MHTRSFKITKNLVSETEMPCLLRVSDHRNYILLHKIPSIHQQLSAISMTDGMGTRELIFYGMNSLH